jgi:hypothetical protein
LACPLPLPAPLPLPCARVGEGEGDGFGADEATAWRSVRVPVGAAANAAGDDAPPDVTGPKGCTAVDGVVADRTGDRLTREGATR